MIRKSDTCNNECTLNHTFKCMHLYCILKILVKKVPHSHYSIEEKGFSQSYVITSFSSLLILFLQ